MKERIRTIRLMEKLTANPAAGETLGITASAEARREPGNEEREKGKCWNESKS